MTPEQLQFEYLIKAIKALEEDNKLLKSLVENMNSNRTARMREVDKENSRLRELLADMSCCCSGCTKHNLALEEKALDGMVGDEVL